MTRRAFIGSDRPGIPALASRSPSAKTYGAGSLLAAAIAVMSLGSVTSAAQEAGFLEGLKRHSIVSSTVPANGDQNPYAIVVAPVSAGKIERHDVLVSNFNDKANLQGLGTTIVAYRPSTRKLSLFAAIPRKLPECPGGVGLTTAMTMLKSGWVIVGSLPSDDGTTATKGQGCLIVLDQQGNVAKTLSAPELNGPWGNMAVIDEGATATLFVSNAGHGIGAPGQDIVREANVLRIKLSMAGDKPPEMVSRTVIGSGFGEQADKDVFIIGPTGLALGENGTLYVSDAIDNRIVAIPNAAARIDSAGTGIEVTKDGMLKRPLAMMFAPNGHLVVSNGLNGQVVEIDPITGRQLFARWIDPNKAQTPPGSGDLFGIAMTPDGKGFYFVEDEVNMLAIAH